MATPRELGGFSSPAPHLGGSVLMAGSVPEDSRVTLRYLAEVMATPVLGQSHVWEDSIFRLLSFGLHSPENFRPSESRAHLGAGVTPSWGSWSGGEDRALLCSVVEGDGGGGQAETKRPLLGLGGPHTSATGAEEQVRRCQAAH